MTNAVRTGLFFAVATLIASAAFAADRVRTLQGSSSTGRLTQVTPEEVTLESGSTPKKFAVNEIETVTFDQEPTELAQGPPPPAPAATSRPWRSWSGYPRSKPAGRR